MDWAELTVIGLVELERAGLDAGLGCDGLDWTGLEWAEMCCTALEWDGLDRAGLGWAGMGRDVM